MSQYTVEKLNTEFHVKELKTQAVIYRTKDKASAKKKQNFLNSGGGFAGDTPLFFNLMLAMPKESL